MKLLSLLALGHDFLACISVLKPRRRWLILLAESFTEFISPCPTALGAGSLVHIQHLLACLKIQPWVFIAHLFSSELWREHSGGRFLSLTLCPFTQDIVFEEPPSPNPGLGGGWRQAQEAVIKREELDWAKDKPNPTPPWIRELREDTTPLCSFSRYKNEINNSVQLMAL